MPAAVVPYAVVEEPYTTPPAVVEVAPVPPRAMPNVPEVSLSVLNAGISAATNALKLGTLSAVAPAAKT